MTVNSSSSPNNTDVASDMLVASLLGRCGRPTACRGHKVLTGYDTSLREPHSSSTSRTSHVRSYAAAAFDFEATRRVY